MPGLILTALMKISQYLRRGYDRFAVSDFVIDAGGKLLSPALDIGTGKGLTAMALAKKGLEVISVDIEANEEALSVVETDSPCAMDIKNVWNKLGLTGD